MPSLTRHASSSSSAGSVSTYISIITDPIASCRDDENPINNIKDPEPIQDDIFEVGQILARSLDRGYGPDGTHEYQYLVRWEGYGPAEDTWEMRSNLLEAASELVEEFDAMEHHFTILDSCGLKPRSYLVRYGLALPYAIPSPSCQLVWHTAYQIKSKLKISFGTVDAAIRAFDNPRAYKTTPTPSLTFTPSPSVSTRPKKKKERSLHNDRALLAVLEKQRNKRKRSSNSGHATVTVNDSYRIRWREKKTVKEEWMARQKMTQVFGAEMAKQAVSTFNERTEPTIGMKGKGGNADVAAPTVSDYEKERLRNIEENKEMMRQLGLVV